MPHMNARLAKIEFLGNGEDKVKAAVVTVEVEIIQVGSPFGDLVTAVTNIAVAPTDSLQQIFDRAADKAAQSLRTASTYSDTDLARRMGAAKSYELS
jgi:hypothetical protein